ncbi:MAG: glycosyltransferase family 2 protein [Candidatus Rokuibacteriota bacterium]
MSPAVSTWTLTSWIEQAALHPGPLVSVILPTHNRAALLPRAVASVRAQVYPAWEIVLVDDGSTDATPAVAERLRAEIGAARLQILRVAPGGVCAARNHGLAATKGSLIAYLDDDNTMHPLWLKAVAWAFAQRPDVDVVYGGSTGSRSSSTAVTTGTSGFTRRRPRSPRRSWPAWARIPCSRSTRSRIDSSPPTTPSTVRAPIAAPRRSGVSCGTFWTGSRASAGCRRRSSAARPGICSSPSSGRAMRWVISSGICTIPPTRATTRRSPGSSAIRSSTSTGVSTVRSRSTSPFSARRPRSSSS